MDGFKVINGGKVPVYAGQKGNGETTTASGGEKTRQTKHKTFLPQEFRHAVMTLQDAIMRPELALKEIPTATQLAPFSVAISAEVTSTAATAASALHSVATEDEELATGRFILLYNPDFDETWKGNFRIVTYIRAELEPDIGRDVMAGSLVWNWLQEALLKHRSRFANAGGTATRVLSEGFGILEDETQRNNIELRASWTPLSSYMQEHLQAWADMVCSFAGLPPTHESITPISKFRLNHRSDR